MLLAAEPVDDDPLLERFRAIRKERLKEAGMDPVASVAPGDRIPGHGGPMVLGATFV